MVRDAVPKWWTSEDFGCFVNYLIIWISTLIFPKSWCVKHCVVFAENDEVWEKKVRLGQERLLPRVYSITMVYINGEELQQESESTNISVGSISCYTAQLR